MSENEKPVKPIIAVFTDDSGVVISQKQYAELHGETQESKRHYYDGWQTHNSAGKKKNKQGKEKLDKASAVVEVVNPSKNNELMVCSICKVQVKTTNYKKHLAKVHPKSQSPNAQTSKKNQGIKQEKIEVDNRVKCPICEHKAHYGDLFIHIMVSHPEKNPKKVMAEYNREYRKRLKVEKIEREMDQVFSEYEKLKQSHDEPRDAGKYLGFMSRENGKFGSLPLHDNYSDESDAA